MVKHIRFQINNVPSYAVNHKYWIVRDCGKDGMWFYGAYSRLKIAQSISKTIDNGFVYKNIGFIDKEK